MKLNVTRNLTVRVDALDGWYLGGTGFRRGDGTRYRLCDLHVGPWAVALFWTVTR